MSYSWSKRCDCVLANSGPSQFPQLEYRLKIQRQITREALRQYEASVEVC